MQRIYPYKAFLGPVIPNWLLKRSDVTAGEKICYARLCQYAGNKNYCHPKQSTLAKEIGYTQSTVNGIIQKLVDKGLLLKEKTGGSYKYFFLKHEWVDYRQTDTIRRRESRSSKEDLATIIKTYFNLKNYKDEHYQRVHYKRNVKIAKELLELAQNECAKVCQVLNYAPKFFAEKGLEWTLETVSKYWIEIQRPRRRIP